MKKNMKSSSILLGGLFLLGAVCSCTQTAPDYASYVNPFIGTGGHGHTYPGAVVPNGMIQPSPDTRIYEWDACSGYYYADTTINGFSHTHVSGTGCADYGGCAADAHCRSAGLPLHGLEEPADGVRLCLFPRE
mgnify:CR=1 FL=1